ncbi:hypothetical protein PCE1_002096 [Barthelona sp. PCE]
MPFDYTVNSVRESIIRGYEGTNLKQQNKSLRYLHDFVDKADRPFEILLKLLSDTKQDVRVHSAVLLKQCLWNRSLELRISTLEELVESLFYQVRLNSDGSDIEEQRYACQLCYSLSSIYLTRLTEEDKEQFLSMVSTLMDDRFYNAILQFFYCLLKDLKKVISEKDRFEELQYLNEYFEDFEQILQLVKRRIRISPYACDVLTELLNNNIISIESIFADGLHEVLLDTMFDVGLSKGICRCLNHIILMFPEDVTIENSDEVVVEFLRAFLMKGDMFRDAIQEGTLIPALVSVFFTFFSKFIKRLVMMFFVRDATTESQENINESLITPVLEPHRTVTAEIQEMAEEVVVELLNWHSFLLENIDSSEAEALLELIECQRQHLPKSYQIDHFSRLIEIVLSFYTDWSPEDEAEESVVDYALQDFLLSLEDQYFLLLFKLQLNIDLDMDAIQSNNFSRLMLVDQFRYLEFENKVRFLLGFLKVFKVLSVERFYLEKRYRSFFNLLEIILCGQLSFVGGVGASQFDTINGLVMNIISCYAPVFIELIPDTELFDLLESIFEHMMDTSAIQNSAFIAACDFLCSVSLLRQLHEVDVLDTLFGHYVSKREFHTPQIIKHIARLIMALDVCVANRCIELLLNTLLEAEDADMLNEELNLMAVFFRNFNYVITSSNNRNPAMVTDWFKQLDEEYQGAVQDVAQAYIDREIAKFKICLCRSWLLVHLDDLQSLSPAIGPYSDFVSSCLIAGGGAWTDEDLSAIWQYNQELLSMELEPEVIGLFVAFSKLNASLGIDVVLSLLGMISENIWAMNKTSREKIVLYNSYVAELINLMVVIAKNMSHDDEIEEFHIFLKKCDEVFPNFWVFVCEALLCWESEINYHVFKLVNWILHKNYTFESDVLKNLCLYLIRAFIETPWHNFAPLHRKRVAKCVMLLQKNYDDLTNHFWEAVFLNLDSIECVFDDKSQLMEFIGEFTDAKSIKEIEKKLQDMRLMFSQRE